MIFRVFFWDALRIRAARGGCRFRRKLAITGMPKVANCCTKLEFLFISPGRRRGAGGGLAARDDVDKTRIGALGHSEGGVIVAGLAKQEAVAFGVLLAGPARSGREVSVRQNLEALLSLGDLEGAQRLAREVLQGEPPLDLIPRAEAVLTATDLP